MEIIGVVQRLYGELVGTQGLADVPSMPPLKGLYFCPMLQKQKLWVSIRFGHMTGDESRRAVSLNIYVPGVGVGGIDMQLLEVQAFTGPKGQRAEILPHFQQLTQCDPDVVAECLSIIARFEELKHQ